MRTLDLNDGTSIPAIGFGTYPLRGDEGVEAIVSALRNGYRLLDSAAMYRNEVEVGKALRRSGVSPDEVIVQTKIQGRHHEKQLALQALVESAERLGVETIDIGMIHWPNPARGLYLDAWEALLEAQQRGLVRTVGVANFAAAHLERLVRETGVPPAINQIEVHPWFPQQAMIAENTRLGIITQAWSPLGKAMPPFGKEPVAGPAQKYGVSPAQVLLRWHVQRGVVPLPKSATPARQLENLDVFGFELTDDEVEAINGLGRPDGRLFNGDPDTHEQL